MIKTSDKNKHLTFEQRQDIQKALRLGNTFKTIARHLSKSPSTISREVNYYA